MAKRTGCRLLEDETYRDLSYAPPLPLAASLSHSVISVSSPLQGLRRAGRADGRLITRDPVLQQTFLAAKELIGICGSAIDDWVGLQVMRPRGDLLAATISADAPSGFDEVDALHRSPSPCWSGSRPPAAWSAFRA